MQFQKAEKRKAKLRLGLAGTSGSGKTFGALLIAKGLGGKIAVIDTERSSASLYANIVEFDALELEPPFSPEIFSEAIRTAEKAGYDTLIIDSITHEWSGTGGCLDILDVLTKTKYRGNSWSAWSDLTPRHRAFLDTILQSKMHIIATMRSKTETAQSNENGKVKVTKLGMKNEQRDGTEYEFTTVLDLSNDGNYATCSKDRTGLFANKDPFVIQISTGVDLIEWLNSGAEEKKEEDITIEYVVKRVKEAYRRSGPGVIEKLKEAGLPSSSDELNAKPEAMFNVLEIVKMF